MNIEPGLEMLYDFAALCAADILLKSQSTFSGVSVFFNEKQVEIWVSQRDGEALLRQATWHGFAFSQTRSSTDSSPPATSRC
jgi:hypothetical protein